MTINIEIGEGWRSSEPKILLYISDDFQLHMCSDGRNSTEQSINSVHSSRAIILKIKTLLHSISFTKKVFVVIVIFHFLIYWFFGIFLYSFLYSKDFLSANYPFLSLDFNFDWIVFEGFMNTPSLVYSAGYYNPLINLPAYLLYLSAWLIPCRQWLSLNMYQALSVFDFGMFLFNLGICFLIYKIMKNDKVQKLSGKTILSNPFILMSIYMGASLLYFEYYGGENDVISGFFLLLGLYYYLNEKEHFMYLSWGISLIFRASLVIFIIFLIFHGPLKRLLKNIAFLALSQLPNIIMFMIWPSYVPGFIGNNLYRLGVSLMPHNPANLAQFFFMNYYIDIATSEIYIFCSTLPLSLYVFIECKKSLTVFDKLMILTLLSIVLIPAYWGNDMIITLGFYLVWIALKKPGLNGSVRFLNFIIAIPFLSYLSWLNFPYFSFVFLIALIWLNLLFIFSKKESTIHS